MQLHWAPPDPRARVASALEIHFGFPRFLAISTVAHVLAAVAVVSLSGPLGPARFDPGPVVRTIDFTEAPPVPSRPPRGDPQAIGLPSPGIRVARPAPAASPSASTRRSSSSGRTFTPPPPESAAALPTTTTPTAESRPAVDTPSAPRGDAPPPSQDDAQLASATPKTIGSAGVRRPPASVTPPSAATDSAASAMPGGASARDAGAGPVGTVALPPGLLKGARGASAGDGTAPAGGGRPGATEGTRGGVDVADPDFSEYFRIVERRVRTAWKFPESLGGTTQTVKIGFALSPEGSLREVRVVSSSSSTLNDSALTAMRQAAPFPPLPEKFRGLAGQPLVMSFTVTIR